MSDLKWNSYFFYLNTKDVSLSSLLKEVCHRAMFQEVLFFHADLKGQDSVKLNCVHTVIAESKHSCPWLYSPLTISQHLCSSSACSILMLPIPLMLPLWNPCPVQVPELSAYYWRIKLNFCWDSNPSSALHSLCGLGLVPNCSKPIFYAYKRGKYLPQRMITQLNKVQWSSSQGHIQ
jgi:hypothetical protein